MKLEKQTEKELLKRKGYYKRIKRRKIKRQNQGKFKKELIDIK
jgi:hypothetical protein